MKLSFDILALSGDTQGGATDTLIVRNVEFFVSPCSVAGDDIDRTAELSPEIGGECAGRDFVSIGSAHAPDSDWFNNSLKKETTFDWSESASLHDSKSAIEYGQREDQKFAAGLHQRQQEKVICQALRELKG